MKNPPATNSTLRRITVLGSSLAVGFATASLEALQPNFSFRFSVKTGLAFAVGSTFLYAYWRILLSPSKTPAQNRLRFAGSALLVLGGVAAFLYPLRFIAPNNFSEVITGLVVAFCGLSGVATLLLFCKRFLAEDTRRNSR